MVYSSNLPFYSRTLLLNHSRASKGDSLLRIGLLADAAERGGDSGCREEYYSGSFSMNEE